MRDAYVIQCTNQSMWGIRADDWRGSIRDMIGSRKSRKKYACSKVIVVHIFHISEVALPPAGSMVVYETTSVTQTHAADRGNVQELVSRDVLTPATPARLT